MKRKSQRKQPVLFLLALLLAGEASAARMHDKLVDRVGAAIDGAPVPAVDSDYLLMLDRESRLPGGELVGKKARGTYNFRAMAWAAEYVRAWRGGALPAWVPPQRAQGYKDFWRAKAREYFERERNEGLMGGEQLCADPHHNFHVAAAALIRIGALEFRHEELIAASGQYFRDLFAVYSAVATPDGSICMAGARVKGDAPPCTEVGSMIFRTVRGLPQQGAAVREPLMWNQNYYAAARAVRLLVERGDDLGGAAKMQPQDLANVKLVYPMRVERYADSVRTIVPGDPGSFYLREQFASFTEMRFPQAWLNFRKLRRAGLLTFIKGWSASPPPAAAPPRIAVTSLPAFGPKPGEPASRVDPARP